MTSGPRPGRVRLRFAGKIAGAGSTSGVRVVVGRWTATPWGPFGDAMVETPDGHRVLLAPTAQVAELLEATYVFDEVRVEPFEVTDPFSVRSPSLTLALEIGRRRALGLALRAVPRRLAESPAWCTVTDPVARVALRGVRTRGVAREGRREWYGATDARAVVALGGTFDGRDLGSLAPVDPPTHFGFSSTPRLPTLTTVVSTIEVAAGR